MKYVSLLIALAGIFPLSLLMRSAPVIQKYAWTAVGILPFLIQAVHIDIGLISWGNKWFGYVYGIEISIIDLIVAALFIISKKPKDGINYHFPFILYFIAILISFHQADEPMASAFYLFQYAKVYFLIIVVARASVDEAVSAELLKGMALGLVIQIFVISWQRWGQHMIQPTGTFIHQNTLGLAAHFVVFPHMMLLLAGLRRLQFALIPVTGMLIAALIASRAALGFIVLGLVVCMSVSFLRRWTSHKAKIALICILGAVAMAPVAATSFQARFEATPLDEAEYNERAAFNRAALMILNDRPMGVGANHYVNEAKNAGYSIRAGVIPFEGNLNNIVHNAYLLAAAETGYFGMVSFVLILLMPFYTAFRYGWLARQSRVGDLLLGCGIAILIVGLHSFLEYIFFGKGVQYLFGITAGIIFGSAAKVRSMRRVRDSEPFRGKALRTLG